VDPDELVERFGADTVRLALLYAARPQRSLNWSDSAVLRCHRFLGQVWDYCQRHAPAGGEDDAAGGQQAGEERDATEHLRRRLEKWLEAGVARTTQDMEGLETHSAARNVMRLFDRIRDFEKRVLARAGELGPADAQALREALLVLCRLLAPLTPHVAEELLLVLGEEDGEALAPWPGVSLRVAA
jgi:leucyl-tRNA synthetase